MPVTRGKARLMESQEEEMEQEIPQQLPETQDEGEDEEQHTSTEAEAAEVDLKEMAKQLTKTLKHLLTTHQRLENDAAMIQAGMDELHRMQEARAERIVGRLKNASSTILTFGDTSQGERLEDEGNDNEEETMH
ncbi:hypothetical protein F441_08827 [Phytophthora nicotianae CJ01A1]|uniref:Uncharacterized protein n=5 Tax=Phytophthora nicotianae TaxID=4792 RepID=V9F5M6_PHYNI|nr:hypothetical protein F443_08849 [Phytophthora nicotianae P1569]ETK86749.1 hypothetical protein L915_08680 [Phytophthora nicotianae]ETO75512.1 hypothetical protein F444_08917 [Phytophthora nicotianae P1976]ETP16597.1 hypothetical protein F441_08829 [Phytophthora nicotianae CJ01A1]ETP44659.1 hypothetical protein F442_08791 [Phytophthora nicotianae P10297]